MTENVIGQTWTAKYFVDELGSFPGAECHVPPMLGTVLRVLRAVGVAPVRLRRAHGGWLLSVSPRLATFQRLFIIFCSTLYLPGLILDFRLNNYLRVSTVPLTTAMWLFEICLVLGATMPRVLGGPRAMKRLMVLLKQIKEVNNGLNNHSSSSIRARRISKIVSITYLISICVIHIMGYCEIFMYSQNYLVPVLYGSHYYMSIIVVLCMLQCSFTIVAINSTHTALNNKLQRLLESTYKHNNAVNPKHGHLLVTIRHLADCYESVCDMVTQVEKDSGIFLLFVYTLSVMYLIITPYNFVELIVLRTSSNSYKRYSRLMQGTWCLFHVCNLLVITEPCHWMQNQMQRTQFLLSRLVRQAGPTHDRISRELELFLLEVQMRGPVLSPMGVFTISRALMASIIVCVGTYLVIIVQMKL